MKKSEILSSYHITKLDDGCVFIKNAQFNFFYQVADLVVKEEHKGQYRYFGGLQCDYHEDSIEYKNLEAWLCEIAETVLNIKLETRYLSQP